MSGSKKGGAIYLMVLGAILVLAGGSFMYLMGRSYQRAKEMRGWPEVEALVLESQIKTRNEANDVVLNEYQLDILYSYSFEEKGYTSERLTLRENSWSKDRKKIEDLLKKYPVNRSVSAYVNPVDPEVAVIEPDTKAAGYSIWFPGVIMIGGLGVMAGAVRSLRS